MQTERNAPVVAGGVFQEEESRTRRDAEVTCKDDDGDGKRFRLNRTLDRGPGLLRGWAQFVSITTRKESWRNRLRQITAHFAFV